MSDSLEEFLTSYRKEEYVKPSVTVDVVVFTIHDGELHALMIQRRDHPFKDAWALPGGFVNVGDGASDQGESLQDAARRELMEETSINVSHDQLIQVGAYGEPGRDPRTRVISIAFLALMSWEQVSGMVAGDDARDAKWVSVDAVLQLGSLAFDHMTILRDALARLRAESKSDRVLKALLPTAFTIRDYRIYLSIVLGRSLTHHDSVHFFMRNLIKNGIIREAGVARNIREGATSRGRPPTLYTFV